MMTTLNNISSSRLKLCLLFVVLFILFVSILGILSFGNPQYHRFIYQFQLELNSGNVFYKHLKPSNVFTGVWIKWYPFPSSAILEKAEYQNGLLNGKVIKYYRNGKIENISAFKNGVLFGPEIRIFDDGFKYIYFYIEGTLVDRDQYLAACAKDPTLPKPPDEEVKEPLIPKIPSKQKPKKPPTKL